MCGSGREGPEAAQDLLHHEAVHAAVAVPEGMDEHEPEAEEGRDRHAVHPLRVDPPGL